ncbi:MAG: M48 family metallopeptidase [Proteobacteria bacterium]|nr:M48 family metallopeptidase [Pseudomonadota bacterium]
MRLKGRLFDGETSTSHVAILFIDEHGYIKSAPDIMPPSSFKDVIISSRVGNTPRTLTFPTGEIFETVDHEILDGIIKQQGRNESRVHLLESNTKYVVSALVFLIGFIAWGSVWGIPWLSTKVAYALPAEINTYIAQGTLETLDDRIFKESLLETKRQRKLTDAFEKLLPDDKQQFSYKLVFRSGGFIGANAFALPDGTIVVTDELVNLAEHDDEIMSVLLHEIGHVEYRHGLRSIINHAGLTTLVLTVTGDVNSAGAMVLALPNVLLESSYSRDLEWEADTYSLAYMQKNNIATEHFANFMERLENYSFEIDEENDEQLSYECPGSDDMDITDITNTDQDSIDNDIETESQDKKQTPPDLGWLNYISSHPPSADRIARFRKQTNDETINSN